MAYLVFSFGRRFLSSLTTGCSKLHLLFIDCEGSQWVIFPFSQKNIFDELLQLRDEFRPSLGSLYPSYASPYSPFFTQECNGGLFFITCDVVPIKILLFMSKSIQKSLTDFRPNLFLIFGQEPWNPLSNNFSETKMISNNGCRTPIANTHFGCNFFNSEPQRSHSESSRMARMLSSVRLDLAHPSRLLFLTLSCPPLNCLTHVYTRFWDSVLSRNCAFKRVKIS